jgi:hypothetical protein
VEIDVLAHLSIDMGLDLEPVFSRGLLAAISSFVDHIHLLLLVVDVLRGVSVLKVDI